MDFNPYTTPNAALKRVAEAENTSGLGRAATIPAGVRGWSWGAFLLHWIWGVPNRTYISLLVMVPYVGFVMTIVLGIKGREWAWRNKRWESVEHFDRVQRKWSFWAVALVIGVAVIGILAAIAIPAYQDYGVRAARMR